MNKGFKMNYTREEKRKMLDAIQIRRARVTKYIDKCTGSRSLARDHEEWMFWTKEINDSFIRIVELNKLYLTAIDEMYPSFQ